MRGGSSARPGDPAGAAWPGEGGIRFPVSIKAVITRGERACLLRNERGEWELPGGRLEPGEQPAAALTREVAEELGLEVRVGQILDAWNMEVLPRREVFIVAYRCDEAEPGQERLSGEHDRCEWFETSQLEGLPLPAGYSRAIRLALSHEVAAQPPGGLLHEPG